MQAQVRCTPGVGAWASLQGNPSPLLGSTRERVTSRLGVSGGPVTLGRSELHPQGRRPPARAEGVTPRGPACGV